MPMKVSFYGRYSSIMQTEQSIEGQLHVCEKYAAEHGMQIVAHYIDRATTGTNDNRPEFQRMIADSKSGKFDGVLVYKLDRFARNRYDSVFYKKVLRDNGVRVISATENITDSPEGIIMEGLLESMDEYYSAELGRKMKRGKIESFHKGRFIGKLAPFGYTVEDHRLAVDPLTAPLAQEIFKRYADGEKQNQIVTDLNRRGIKNAAGRKWNKVNLTMMFKNRIYIGIYSVSDYGEMPCPAIIEKEVFDKVQKVKEDSIHRARECKTDYDYILTGRMVCAQCGASVCGVSAGEGKYHYYQCHKNHCGHKLRADELHERVRGALREYLTDEKLDEMAAAAFAEYEKETAPTSERELLEKELADVQKQLSNAVKAVLSGYDSEELKATMKVLEGHKELLIAQLDCISAPAPKLTYEHFRLALQMVIENAQTDDFRELLDTVVNKIIVDDQDVTICINLTDEINVPPLEQIRFRVMDKSIY